MLRLIPIALALFLSSCTEMAKAPVSLGASEANKPNILLIVADDLALSDIAAFGGEIPTPNIDRLAGEGIVLTNFYSAPTCSPTRAMLLTGVDNHLAGLGNMQELMAPNQRNQPGYEGHLNSRVVTLAEILRADGYRTFMAGKWHLGLEPDQDPSKRGFERSFTMLMGGASHFSDMAGPTSAQPQAIYRRDGKNVDHLPADFYSTTAYTDEIISYINEGRGAEKPFFAYLAYTAPHWPLQAPDRSIEKFAAHYDGGYDVLRAKRFERQMELGLIPDSAILPSRQFAPSWDSLSTDEKARQARLMEIYAAMVWELDQALGRLLDNLQASGELKNTLVVFVSDNGPEGSELRHPLFSSWLAQFDNRLENLGRQGSFATYGPGWAEAGAASFSGFKSYVSEGGVRVPAIVRMPIGAGAGTRSSSLASVKDVVPTILEFVDVGWASPQSVDGAAMHRPSGSSFLQLLTGEQGGAAHRSFAMELFGRRSVRKGSWKAVLQEPPIGDGGWHLFDLSSDPGETSDLADNNPNKMSELLAIYKQYETENAIIYPEGQAGY